MPGSRRASIVLPVPGGPASRRLWRPAAASSSARRARSCPRTSAKSGARTRSRSPFGGTYGGGRLRPLRYETASDRWRSGIGSTPARAASGDDSAGQRMRSRPMRLAPSATARTPPTGRSRPSSASSPTTACARSDAASTCPEAARIANAIERSKADPSLRSPAGARLTTTRPFGNSSSAETIPLRTRSFASWQARSASPTMVRVGFPSARWASTSTRRGSRPTRAWVVARPSTLRP